MRQTRETKLVNDLRWARQNLKDNGWLAMPSRGVWQITVAGRQKLFRVAKAFQTKQADEVCFDRFNNKFIEVLKALAAKHDVALPEQVTGEPVHSFIIDKFEVAVSDFSESYVADVDDRGSVFDIITRSNALPTTRLESKTPRWSNATAFVCCRSCMST
jgi:restriction endonuclease Mrr